MDSFMATELAYKNGYAKGYDDGKNDAVKHGRWLYKKTHQGVKCFCSECGEIPECFEPNYCPNCGSNNVY